MDFDKVLYSTVAGSRARGLHATTEDVLSGYASKPSDYDYRNVYLTYPGNEWKLNASKQTHYKGDNSDETYVEFKEFCRQLATSSPEVHELLWVDYSRLLKTSPDFDHLRKFRSLLLSLKMVHRLLAAAGTADYAVLLDALEEGRVKVLRDYDWGKGSLLSSSLRAYAHSKLNVGREADMSKKDHSKQMADALRRLYVARHMLQSHTRGGDAQLFVDFEDNYAGDYVFGKFLKNVRFGLVSMGDAVEKHRELHSDVQDLLNKTKLREEPALALLDEVMQETYKRYKDKE